MYSHTIQQHPVDDRWQTDVTNDIKPLSYRHEGKDGNAHTNVGTLGIVHAESVVVEGSEDGDEAKGKHLGKKRKEKREVK